ncbi:MAG TPA: histidine kinase dimerization/phospho-acceptor domain-containing protein [Opitutaceae bacterium]|nr:histidine kinase dimerization/phospho-acceptor domain-containing protein [Opitutaceae bacterium]
MNVKFPFSRSESAETGRLQARLTELEASCRIKDQFFSKLSHELRTPLTAIVLWTTLLQGEEVGESDWREALKLLEQSAQELQQLADELVDLARPAPVREPA